MKIVLLSTSDITGGAAVVSKRIVEALRGAGHDATMVVLNRNGQQCSYVKEVPGSGMSRRFPFLAERLEIFLHNSFNRDDLFKVSTASCGKYVSQIKEVREADVIMMGWINQGFISLKEIAKLCSLKKPVIWTMHDQWPMTGICHLSGTCERFKVHCGECPLLHARKGSNDISHRTWEKKKSLYQTFTNLKFVAVSNWLAGKAAESSLLRDKNVHVIHNPIFIPQVEPLNEEKRRPIIIMGAARLDDNVKNLDLAVAALNRVWIEKGESLPGLKALFYGNLRNRDAFNGLKMPFEWLGPLSQQDVVKVFNLGKVVLSTSRFEMLPTTIVEGLAWGCVAATTSTGGQSDIIIENENGFKADDTAESMADAIIKAIECNASPSSMRASVEKKFNPEIIAREYLDLIAKGI